MTIIHLFSVLFISLMWLYYFRKIDVFERDKLSLQLLMFILGIGSFFISIGLYQQVLGTSYLPYNGKWLHDLVYSFAGSVIVKESVKVIPFILFFQVFKKEINEPIDIIVFISIGALGYSAVENLMFLNKYGSLDMGIDVVFSTLNHMICSAVVGYGVVVYFYKSQKKSLLPIVSHFFLACLLHGLFSFILNFYYENILHLIILLSTYFLFTISFFMTILNNSLNNSSFFSYKKGILTTKLSLRLLTLFSIAYLLVCVCISAETKLAFGLNLSLLNILTLGYIIGILCARMGSFTLIQGRWTRLRLELPFHQVISANGKSSRWKMRGESSLEALLCPYYQEYFTLNPMTRGKSYLGSPRLAYIERKIFVKDDTPFYVTRVYSGDKTGPYEIMLMAIKKSGEVLHNNCPMVALLKISHLAGFDSPKMSPRKYKFTSWALIGDLNKIRAKENVIHL